ALEIEKGRIQQHANDSNVRKQLVQQPQALSCQFDCVEDHPCNVATGLIEAWNQSCFDRIHASHEDNRDRRGCRLSTLPHSGIADDRGYLASDEIWGQSGDPIDLIVRPAIFDGDVLALYKSGLAQALPKCFDEVFGTCGSRAPEEPDHWD